MSPRLVAPLAFMAPPISVTIWSDYVCPWCYIGLTEVERLRSRWDFAVDWRPFLLRPETPDEGMPLPDRIKAFLANPENPLSTRAKKLGLTMVHRDVVPSTRRAHQAAAWARTQGAFEPFHHALLERYWSRGQDLHAWDTLKAAAVDAGLNPDTLEAEVATGRFIAPMQASLAAAHDLGVSAVPTFLVADQYVIQGAQEGSAFVQVFEKLGLTARVAS